MSAMTSENRFTNYHRAMAAYDIVTASDIATREAMLCEQQANMKLAGIWLRQVTTTLFYQGKYPEAARQAERSAEMQPDAYERALALQWLACAQLFDAKRHAAFITLGKAEEIGRSFAKDSHLKAIRTGIWALALCLEGDVERALADWMTAASLMKQNGRLTHAAVYINSIGFELAKQGRLREAEAHLLSSLEYIARQPHLPSEGVIYDSVGYLNMLMGRYGDAERYLNRSAQILERIPDKPQLVGTVLHLSELYERTHKRESARSEAERALRLAGEAGLERLGSDARNRLLSIDAGPAKTTHRGCFHGLVYSSVKMQSLINRLKVIAATDEVVLVLGETGTGKELVARAIHRESKRRLNPFIPFNCSALSRELIESRLFGHRKGAFTGANCDHLGVIRAAAGGTLFLDEIGDLTIEAQGALLRFLQSGEIQPLGASMPVTLDVRVIAATNRDLKAEAEAGRFRHDLYYRLNVATLCLPPLWSRPEDMEELARHFARLYSKQYGLPESAFTREEMARLAQHDWPGNVRELENHIKRRILFGETEIQTNGFHDNGNGVQWRGLSTDEKRARVIDALQSKGGNVTAAAKQLGISRRTIQRSKYGTKQ